jgi:hypothetical protein
MHYLVLLVELAQLKVLAGRIRRLQMSPIHGLVPQLALPIFLSAAAQVQLRRPVGAPIHLRANTKPEVLVLRVQLVPILDG